jgi:hypothetical protein
MGRFWNREMSVSLGVDPVEPSRPVGYRPIENTAGAPINASAIWTLPE